MENPYHLPLPAIWTGYYEGPQGTIIFLGCRMKTVLGPPNSLTPYLRSAIQKKKKKSFKLEKKENCYSTWQVRALGLFRHREAVRQEAQGFSR